MVTDSRPNISSRSSLKVIVGIMNVITVKINIELLIQRMYLKLITCNLLIMNNFEIEIILLDVNVAVFFNLSNCINYIYNNNYLVTSYSYN